MGDGAVVRLRTSRKARRNQVLWVLVGLVGLPLFVGVGLVLIDHANLVDGMIVGLAGGVFLPLVVLTELVTQRYVVHGTTLVYGPFRRRLELPQVSTVVAYQKGGPLNPWLFLRLDRMRIRVGEGFCRCRYEAEGLHALADGLAKSPLVPVQDGARWLTTSPPTPLSRHGRSGKDRRGAGRPEAAGQAPGARAGQPSTRTSYLPPGTVSWAKPSWTPRLDTGRPLTMISDRAVAGTAMLPLVPAGVSACRVNSGPADTQRAAMSPCLVGTTPWAQSRLPGWGLMLQLA